MVGPKIHLFSLFIIAECQVVAQHDPCACLLMSWALDINTLKQPDLMLYGSFTSISPQGFSGSSYLVTSVVCHTHKCIIYSSPFLWNSRTQSVWASEQHALTDASHLNLITHSLYYFQTCRAWYEIILHQPFADVRVWMFVLIWNDYNVFLLCSDFTHMVWRWFYVFLPFPVHVNICGIPMWALFEFVF